MKEKLKQNKAITLIALVVTIVVLLILAGISINLLMGKNGIITKATEASKQHKISQIKERLSLEIASAETDAIIRGEKLEKNQLGDIIKKYGELQPDGDTIITTEEKYEISLKEIWYGVLSDSGSYTDKVEQIEILEKELEELKKKYEELEQINSGNSQLLEELRNKIKELEDLLKQQQIEKDAQILELTNKFDTLKNEYDNLNTEYKNFKTVIAKAITDQGVNTDANADANTMANNISNIIGNRKVSVNSIGKGGFTAPEDGIIAYYYYVALTQHDNSSSGYSDARIYLNGSVYQRDYHEIKAWEGYSLCLTQIIEIKKGQSFSASFTCTQPNDKMGWSHYWHTIYVPK